MRPLLRLSALLSLALGAGCYTVETEVRELPPRSAQGPAPRRVPPRAPPRAPPPPPEPAAPPDAPPPPGARFHVPPDRVPASGLCRVWYDALPPDRQPPAMTCARAHRIARNHGGRVIWASARSHQTGDVLSTDYGRVDLDGIPPDRLPPPGYCRVWLDGIPPDRQPPPAQCPQAERDAERMGGRLVYMPSSDVR